MKNKIENLFENMDSLPFLFVGSGISKRYINLPNWEGLLSYLASLVSDNPYAFQKYQNDAKSELGSSYSYNQLMAKIADYIENDLNKIWYDDPKFEENRIKYRKFIKTGTLPIKIEIADFVAKKSDNKSEYLLTEEVENFKKISTHSIAGIITTNYDYFLENIFDFATYSSQDDLLFNTNYEIGEIYKIHGCCKKPNTIMINTSDYEAMEKRNKYLAAKLLTIFVEHPIIFMGYSIEDEDIKQILKSIVACLDKQKLKTLSNRLIFIEKDDKIDNYEFDRHSISFSGINNNLQIMGIRMNDFSILYKSLSKFHSKYPTKILRVLKKDMYNLILTNDPKNKIKVSVPDKLANSEEIEFMAGFGIIELAKRGYASIKVEEIYEDIVFNNGNFNNELLVRESLPDLLRKTAGSLPFYKYIQGFKSDTIPDTLQLYYKDSFDCFKNPTILRRIINQHSISEILAKSFSDNRTIRDIAHLSKEEISTNELLAFIKNMFEKDPHILLNDTIKSDFKRLIKMYDWLKYYAPRP